jgi:predicted RNase H-like HicB family nuclease
MFTQLRERIFRANHGPRELVSMEARRGEPHTIEFNPNGVRKMYEEEFLQEVLDSGHPLQVKFVTEGNPLTDEAERYFRDRRYLSFHLSYDEHEGWFLYAEQLPGVLTYADTVSDALYILQDALNGFAEATLEEGQSGSKSGDMAYLDRVSAQDEL